MARLTEQYLEPGRDKRSSQEARDPLYLTPILVHRFVEQHTQVIAKKLEDQRLLWDYLFGLLEAPDFAWPSVRDQIAVSIAEGPGLRDYRQDIIVRIAEKSAVWPAPRELAQLMDEDLAARLRPIAVPDESHGGDVNFFALGMLSEHGDAETAKRLRRWIEQQDDPERARNRVGRDLWRIDAQQDPQLLLDYIRSDVWRGFDDRLWAMKRALALGIPAQQVRAAILDHAPKAVGHPGLTRSLKHLKVAAREADVLETEDLPDVEKPAEDVH